MQILSLLPYCFLCSYPAAVSVSKHLLNAVLLHVSMLQLVVYRTPINSSLWDILHTRMRRTHRKCMVLAWVDAQIGNASHQLHAFPLSLSSAASYGIQSTSCNNTTPAA
jgi:hypothetical protein